VTIDAGVPASKNGIFKTNFPLDGGRFDREKIQERRYAASSDSKKKAF
jgi:glycogen debranching enzyme